MNHNFTTWFSEARFSIEWQEWLWGETAKPNFRAGWEQER